MAFKQAIRLSWAAVAVEDDPRQFTLSNNLDLLGTLTPHAAFAAGGAGDTFRKIAPGGWLASMEAAKASLR